MGASLWCRVGDGAFFILVGGSLSPSPPPVFSALSSSLPTGAASPLVEVFPLSTLQRGFWMSPPSELQFWEPGLPPSFWCFYLLPSRVGGE